MVFESSHDVHLYDPKLIYRPDTTMFAVATKALSKLKIVRKKHLHDLTVKNETDSHALYETVLNDFTLSRL